MSADQRLALGLGRYLLDDDTARWMTRSVRQLAAGRGVPPYGSVEWLAADRGLQVAAALVAAEAHRRHGLFLADALADELAGMRYARAVADDQDFREFVRSVKALADEPTHAELVQRRAS